jgi:putative iron-regulated protein
MKKFLKNVSVFAVLTLVACTDDNDVKTKDFSSVIDNLANNVILLTYDDLQSKAAALELATIALKNDKSEANFINAKAAWIAARSPWEQSEGFLFGPVDQEGLDPSMDSWPVNVIDLTNVLTSNNILTVPFLDQQEGTLKGFHTIEFLLWGENGAKTIDQLTDRQIEYLAACAGALASDTKKLYEAWSLNGGNYIANILKAGSGSVVYITQKSVLEEMTNAMVAIADEVANGKINDPLVQQDLTLEESRFSANSKADFSDNIRSIKNIYNGSYKAGANQGIYNIIKEKDGALADLVNQKINDAISEIVNLPGTFSSAVVYNSSQVAKAQAAVRDLQTILESKVLPIISNL